MKGDLDGTDYKEIKFECESKVNALEAKLEDFSKKHVSIESDLNEAFKALTSLTGLCSLEDIKLNRELIGSMYPEKFTFENLKHRTARVNEVATIMCEISNALEDKKMGK